MAGQISNSGNVQDEAQEKLFSDNNASGEPKIEIKFLDSKNGDTKIDISEVRQVFVGMGKEELMKFANDPFWVRMRWFLFILFWVLWVGMLAGAIAIILLAPKCDSVSSSHKQENIVYTLDIKNFKDSNGDGLGDIAGLESELDYLKNLGIDTILLDSLMETAPETEDVTDFKALDPKYGNLEDFKKLVETAKNKGLKLLMSFIPNFTSIKHKWFENSVAKMEPFTNYYIWSDPVYGTDETTNPINNWVSTVGGSAWEWNNVRKQYYLHQFNVSQPDLNFRNPEIVNYFKEVLKFWLDLGLNGLHLDKVEYLIEDQSFVNETHGITPGATHYDYNFHSHTRTKFQSETLNVLSDWADVVKNYSGRVFSLNGIQDGDNFEKADFIFRPITVTKSMTAGDLYEALRSRLNKRSQMWGIVCEPKNDCNENVLIGLQAVLLMLPGTTVVHSGLELGLPFYHPFQWDSTTKDEASSGTEKGKFYSNRNVVAEAADPDSYYNTFKKILEQRHTPAVMFGSTNITALNTSVLVVTRIKPGNPQYIAMFNVENSEKSINLSEIFEDLPTKFNLIASSSQFDKKTYSDFKNESTFIKIPGNSFAIFQFILNA